MGEKIAILDAGAQYGKVIDRRVRELNVESVMLPLDTSPDELEKYQGIIISGGPQSVYGEHAPAFHPDLFEVDVPILGICYGMQLMVHVLGGKVERREVREDGPMKITINEPTKLFGSLPREQTVLISHGDSVSKVPGNFSIIAQTKDVIAAMADEKSMRYGVQFHPEVDLTEHGKGILRNFLFAVCRCKGEFTLEDREQIAIDAIKQRVRDENVLALVSGGVDSTVLAALLHKALGKERVKAVHIDHGFMRKNESKQVKIALEKIGVELEVIDAKDLFMSATHEGKRLDETVEPEHKRVIIGDTFITLAREILANMEGEVFLAQGTLRPDLIESASHLASGNADAIKTHHNDSPLARELRSEGKVIEPLADYHKDEVRELGRLLGLPDSIVERQPFPGPGLAIRIICAQSPYLEEYDATLTKLRSAVDERFGVTLLPFKTVGVQGDERSYSYCAAISGPRDFDQLLEYARTIPQRIHNINRVVYLFNEFSGECKRTIPTLLTDENIMLLQEADAIAREGFATVNLAQLPVILMPVGKEQRSIALRPFITNDFMTGMPARPGKEIPLDILYETVERLEALDGVDWVALDLTSKPPGTTEWE